MVQMYYNYFTLPNILTKNLLGKHQEAIAL